MRGLAADRPLPDDAKPGKVFIDGSLEFRPAPRRIDVLDPKQKTAAGPPGQIEIQERRIGMAEMKIAVRARRKTENGWRRHGQVVMRKWSWASGLGQMVM